MHLVKGLFEETIRPTEPIALAHIDGDWYESVEVCLERVWPVLAVGGPMVIDDYAHWSGCRSAVDEFLASNPMCRGSKVTNAPCPLSVPHNHSVSRRTSRRCSRAVTSADSRTACISAGTVRPWSSIENNLLVRPACLVRSLA